MSPRSVGVPAGGFRRIAVLRLSSLGDVVLALPALHALRHAFPGAALDVWVKEEYRDVVRHDPAVTHVRVLERDARRLEDLVSMSAELEDTDLIVDLHGSARTRLLTFRQRAPVLRVRSYRLRRARWVHARWTRPRPAPHALVRYAQTLAPIGVVPSGVPVMHGGADAEAWADAWLAAWGQPGLVAICPAARHATKRWPEEHWLALLGSLRAQGRAVIAFSMRKERVAFPRLVAAVEGDPSSRWCDEPLDRMAALLSRAAFAVTSDSGLMHVAAARGTRVIALFGSTAPELGFAPAGAGHVVLCRHERCQPCTLHGRKRCPKRHFRCMRLLTPDAVLEAVRALATVAPERTS